MKVTGQCLCTETQFNFELREKHVDCCHCSMCRKWGGGPVMMVGVNGSLNFTKNKHVKTYSSSDWAERGFCFNCGSSLFYKLKDNSFCAVPSSLLDEPIELSFTTQIYIDKKPKYYEFANETKLMTESDVLKAFGFE